MKLQILSSADGFALTESVIKDWYNIRCLIQQPYRFEVWSPLWRYTIFFISIWNFGIWLDYA